MRRAADMRFGRHGALHHQEVRAPVAEREHEAEARDQAEDLHAHRILRRRCPCTSSYASSRSGMRARMPSHPPAFITAMIASGEKPSTIRKNCSTSL